MNKPKRILKDEILKDKRIANLLRGVLGLLFLYASLSKVLDPFQFARVIYNYQILPEPLIYPLAAVLPYLEATVGLCLVLGIVKRGAALLAFLSMCVFSVALIFNLVRGINVDCGCFDIQVKSVSNIKMYWYVLRDLVILFWALLVLKQSVSNDSYSFKRSNEAFMTDR